MVERSPIGWALLPLKRYVEFRGRSSRAEFWWFMLFIVLAYVAMWILLIGSIGGLAMAASEPSAGFLGAFGFGMILMVLFWLALIIPTIAVQVRRLHDTGRSGWWLGAFYLLYALYYAMLFAVIGTGFAAGMDGSDTMPEPATALFLGTSLLGILMFVYMIVLIVFYCLPGTRGDNRFGPDPYRRDVAEVFA